MKKYRGVFIKNDREIGLLRQANAMVSLILDEMVANVRPGLPTMFFEEIAQSMCRNFGVKPSFQGYQGYPYALCCSVNETIVHGFPSTTRILQEGDIVSFDMGVIYEGFHGDHARTAFVGEVSAEAKRLSCVTEECLALGIAAAKPGRDLYEISAAIENHAKTAGFGIIRRFVGHGVGARLHEKPEVPNFVPGGLRSGIVLKPGMVLALEPMLSMGSEDVTILPDGWTANTKDGSLVAHWEHSIAITADGAEVLSLSGNYALEGITRSALDKTREIWIKEPVPAKNIAVS